MKTNILFVNALIATLFAVIPLSSQATCGGAHQSQQAGNETSVGGKNIAGGEGTGAEGPIIAGGEGTGVEDLKMTGGEGTGVEGKVLVGNEASIVPASQ